MFGFFGTGETPEQARQRIIDSEPGPHPTRREALELALAHLEASDRPCDLKAADVLAEVLDEYPDED